MRCFPASSYDFKGRRCSPEAPFSRVGYYLHWGVGAPPYHQSWVSHRVANDTLSSVENIVAAIGMVGDGRHGIGCNDYCINTRINFLSAFRCIAHFTEEHSDSARELL